MRTVAGYVLDALVMLAVLAIVLAVALGLPLLLGAVDGWIDGLVGRAHETGCAKAGCWPR